MGVCRVGMVHSVGVWVCNLTIWAWKELLLQ
jgi:hypothetical protein